MYAAVVCLTVAVGVSAAPVPKDEPGPVAKALVGTWKFASNDGATPPWGTATVTFTADGKLTATFGTPEADKFFGNPAGTYRVNRDALTTAITFFKGTPNESKGENVMTIIEVGSTKLRMVYQKGEEKREIVMERVKSDEKKEARPEK